MQRISARKNDAATSESDAVTNVLHALFAERTIVRQKVLLRENDFAKNAKTRAVKFVTKIKTGDVSQKAS